LQVAVVVVEIVDTLLVLLELVVQVQVVVDPMLVVVMEQTHLQKEPEILELMLLAAVAVEEEYSVVMVVMAVLV